jgi:hypothetical protein
VTSEEATDLFILHCSWRDAYAITLSDGVWAAHRHDNPTKVLTADTAPELRWLMRTDYGEWLRTGSCN